MVGRRTFVIAEAGVNHDGSLDRALEMVDVAAAAGADAVKFQTFTSRSLVTADAPKADYQREATGVGKQAEMLRRLELDRSAHEALCRRSRDRSIEFISSAFDIASVHMLADLGIETLKIPSGEITDLPYLRAVGRLGKRVLLSTGMADLEEVRDALNVLASAGTPLSLVTALQCTTAYPAPIEEADLRAMVAMREEFGVAVGYSDHTLGPETALAAVALGATVLEKHFTLDKTLAGPDHRASANPEELAGLIASVRRVELALGDGVKRLSASERANSRIVRKSIVAARDIEVGEQFSEENLTVKRPAGGLSPMRWDEVLGARAPRAFRSDEAVEL